jgi:nucleotide-binding universal stress UspA family protein
MLKILVPVDGSENSIRVADHLIAKAGWLKEPMEIHLLNVQHPLHGEVGLFLDGAQIRDYHHDEGLKALADVRAKLDGAGVEYHCHIGLGEPAEVIAQYALEKDCDEIVMGAQGMDSIASRLLGSVVSKVLELADVPVVLVK